MSKSRRLAKNIGKSIRKKINNFDADIFQFPFGLWLDDLKSHSSSTSPYKKFVFLRMQSVQPPKKSFSLGTIAPNEPPGPDILDHDDIIALTQEVKKFSDSLARLRLLFTDGMDPDEEPSVLIHEGLGEVLFILNPVVKNYPGLQSQDIYLAAKSLIDMIKDHDFQETMLHINVQNFCDAIDQLAMAFSKSVSEFLMGDMGPHIVMTVKTRSMNNIAAEEANHDNVLVKLSADDQDRILTDLDKGVSLALQRAKICSKYISDIITYLEKKTQLEQDYAKNLSRLANTVQNGLKKECFLPLQSVFCTALTQDVDFSTSLQATQAVVHSHNFVEPLTVRKMEHDKTYKIIKEVWQREHRKMTESISNLRKAQNLYNTRQQDCERAHELAMKADGDKQEKRRKAEEEAVLKAAEAETTYKACVAEANQKQQELFKVKKELLAQVREQIQQCDQVIKEVTVEYFQLYHSIMSPLPLQYQTLSESCKNYEPGSQYAEYLRRLPKSTQPSVPEVFTFEPYVQGQRSSDETRKESFHSNGSVSDHVHSPEGSPVASPKRDKYRIPMKAWGHQMPNVTASDTDSASCSSKSHESSPSGSPHRSTRRFMSSQSYDELTEEELIAASASTPLHHSQEKRTQQMKRTLTVAGEDGLDIPSLMLHRGRRNTTFGVDIQEQVDNFQSKVPPIITKCLTEIESRGVMTQGIYRVSGAKRKIDNLCETFDLDPESVDLSEIQPNIISNVLKLYLRQLPEPLLTYRLYSDFIHCAKESMSGHLLSNNLVDHLKSLVGKLPASNYRICAVLMHHLQRVAAQSAINQMSASNLGIVFGPTLLRPLEGPASVASLVDAIPQARAVELLITHAHLIFGPSEDFQVTPTQTPVEQLNQSLEGILVPGQGLIKLMQSSSTKPKVSSSGSEDLPVFDPVTSSVSQPWQCEPCLPGTVGQDANEAKTVAEVEGSELGSEGEELGSDTDDLPELVLPDRSKQLAKPLSFTLSAKCIQGSDQASPHLNSKTPSLGSHTKSSITKATPSTHKVSVTNSDMIAALTTGAGGMASVLMMSAGTFPAEDAAKDPISVKEPPSTDVLPQVIVDGAMVTPGKEANEADNVENKKVQEDVAKKKLHSLQLENIKFLTQPPLYQDLFPSLLPSSLASQGPKVISSDTDSKIMATSNSPLPLANTTSSRTTATSESPNVVIKASTRRSILEEMPIPTLSKPLSMADKGADAVTIPASPTIRRRELPSKIPTSPVAQRSFDGNLGLDKSDSRADRFRQEQRKLVKAIKSDAKIGVGNVDQTDSSLDSPEKERPNPGRSSAIFDDVLSGGCALSSRHSSQSEEMSQETVEISSSKPIAASSEQTTQDRSSPTRTSPFRSSSWTGKTETAKLASGLSRQNPATSAGESQTRSVTVRTRALNMPSASLAKKTTVSVARTSVSNTVTAARSVSSRAGTTCRTSSSSDQSSHICSRMASHSSKSSEEVKTASVIRKGSGRGVELSSSLKSTRLQSEKFSTVRADTEATLDRSSSSSSQSSSPRHRHPSGESSYQARQRKHLTPTSSSAGGHQGKSPSSTGTQSVSKTSSTVQVSPATGKLSQDRTPRFV